MDKILELIPKSLMPLLAAIGLAVIGIMARETMLDVKDMTVRVADLQTQLSVVQATMVTRTEVMAIVREELDREAKRK